MRTLNLLVLSLLTACGSGDHRYPSWRSSTSSSSSSSGSGSGSSSGASSGKSSTVDAAKAWPKWLRGLEYASGYKVENNIDMDATEAGIRFEAPASGTNPEDFVYYHKAGDSWIEGGTWQVKGDSLELDPGSGSASTISLSSALSANCRILERGGKKLFTGGVVEGCDRNTRALTGSECAKVGYYSDGRSTESEDGDVWTSNSVNVTLEPDGFFRKTESYVSGRCYGSTCKSLTNTSAPIVGTWTSTSFSGSSVSWSELADYEFTESDEPCGN